MGKKALSCRDSSHPDFGITNIEQGHTRTWFLRLGIPKHPAVPYHTESFSYNRYGGKQKALKAAREKRDQIKSKGKFKRFYNRKVQRVRVSDVRNTTGIIGVSPAITRHPMLSQGGFTIGFSFKATLCRQYIDAPSARFIGIFGAYWFAANARQKMVGKKPYSKKAIKPFFEEWIKNNKALVAELAEHDIPLFIDSYDYFKDGLTKTKIEPLPFEKLTKNKFLEGIRNQTVIVPCVRITSRTKGHDAKLHLALETLVNGKRLYFCNLKNVPLRRAFIGAYKEKCHAKGISYQSREANTILDEWLKGKKRFLTKIKLSIE